MTEADWNDGGRRLLGMALNGQGIQERDAKGEPVTGDTLLVLLNSGPADETVTLPRWRHAGAWTKVLDTADPDKDGVHLDAGATWTLPSRSSAIWRAKR
jgi:glycogen operon protein